MIVAIGIDIGGTTIKAGLISETGEVLAHVTYETPATIADLLKCFATIRSTLNKQFETTYAHSKDFQLANTVGIASLGVVDEQAGNLVLSANKGWSDVPIRELAQDYLGCRVVLGHDVGSGAVGEAVFGAGQESNHCIFFPIGTGMSAAEVLDGKAHKPSPWMGEIGQICIANPDVQVPKGLHCGQVHAEMPWITTVERAFSTIAIGRRYSELRARQEVEKERAFNEHAARAQAALAALQAAGHRVIPGSKAVMQELSLVDSTGIQDEQNPTPTVEYTTRQVFELANDGCELAAWVIDNALEGQAQAAAQVIAMTGANGLILGGGITNAGDAFLEPFTEKLSHYLGILPMPRVHVATLGTQAQMIGIGYRAIQTEQAHNTQDNLQTIAAHKPVEHNVSTPSTVREQAAPKAMASPETGEHSTQKQPASVGLANEEPSCH